MKQILSSELAKEAPELANQIGESRFVLVRESRFGIPTIISKGNDPILVSTGGVKVEQNEDGTYSSPHCNDPTGHAIYCPSDGRQYTLYRVD